MNQRIIYQTDDGGVAVIVPAPEAVATLVDFTNVCIAVSR